MRVAILFTPLLTLLVSQAQEKAGDAPGPAVKVLFVQVEIRGTLHYGKEYTTVAVKEQAFGPQTISDPKVVEASWRLDLTALKLTAEQMKQLDGKAVQVNGKAKGNSWVMAWPFQVVPSLSVDRFLVVESIKMVGSK